MASHENDTLSDLLGDLEAASKLPAKRRQATVKPTVEKTTSLLYERGALPDELARLVDLVTLRNHLDQASLAAIVRNLYPAGKVDDDVVLCVVGALGHGQLKPALTLQALLLRWLVMAYHLLQNPDILSQAYGVFFNLLGTAAIRPQLCHLLALITRRKHVRPFRIQAILALSRQTGSDPHLTGLLRVFKNYYPEIIVGEVTKGRATAFKHPDPQWRDRVNKIQQQQQLDRQDDGGTRNGFAVNHAMGRQMNGAMASLFPAVHTQHAQESSLTLEEIDKAEKFVDNLEKIELPTQLVAVIADPLLQKLLLLRPDADASARISNWVMACLGDVAAGDTDPALMLDMLEVVHDYVLNTKTLPPLLLTFLQVFLGTWNGVDKRNDVLETVSYTPLGDFKKLYKKLFQLFESSLLDNTAASQVSLLKFYTLLLRRWSIAMRASQDSVDPVLPDGSAGDLVSHVNKLALTLTQTAPGAATQLAILDFYECFASVFSTPRLLRSVDLCIPPALVVYPMVFGDSLVVLSRLCGILAAYKRAWESIMAPSSPAARQLTRREREQVNTFNGFLMDLCNCLWRGRAFATADLNAQGCGIPRALEPALDSYVRAVDSELALGALFGLSYSPVLCLQAISYVRGLEEAEIEASPDGLRSRHAGPVTQASLTRLASRGGVALSFPEYRSGVLKYLESNGFPGVPELMYNTMKNLMKERK
ncbi:Mis6-domain-containing protein [Lasiosphaeria ovina]|uniref:Mis6-domain-containing protein n=1 Tax=Lasiosphaeria ovina TaxID=92902 RepID=A0AAE0N0P5_9PEZI|nr:Mis6-domain-containing protein [Lasiosphaeria ovina]